MVAHMKNGLHRHESYFQVDVSNVKELKTTNRSILNVYCINLNREKKYMFFSSSSQQLNKLFIGKCLNIQWLSSNRVVNSENAAPSIMLPNEYASNISMKFSAFSKLLLC